MAVSEPYLTKVDFSHGGKHFQFDVVRLVLIHIHQGLPTKLLIIEAAVPELWGDFANV